MPADGMAPLVVRTFVDAELTNISTPCKQRIGISRVQYVPPDVAAEIDINFLNNSWCPNDILVNIVPAACRLFGAKPLSETILVYC